jgi:hypothetical protein
MTDTRGPRISARSFFRHLCEHGYSSTQLIGVDSELVELITCSVQERKTTTDAAVIASQDASPSTERKP